MAMIDTGNGARPDRLETPDDCRRLAEYEFAHELSDQARAGDGALERYLSWRVPALERRLEPIAPATAKTQTNEGKVE